MNQSCKKCLLLEAGEKVKYDQLSAYISTLPKEDLVTESEYENRIAFCKSCDFLISGMCRKCGCYVEVRARLKKSSCPDYDNRKW